MLALLCAVFAKSEGDLLLRLQRRDPQALAELYDLYGGMVYRLVLRIVRDAAIAEDLVQEVFLRVWNRAAGFASERGAVGPWLLAIARNRAIDHLRCHAQRDRNTIGFDETEHPSLFADLEAGLVRSDLVKRVKETLERLDPRQRQAVELAYFEGLSQTEIAERMDQPLGTVKTWVRRALQQLRDELRGGGAA